MNKEDKRVFIRLRELDKSCRCCGHGREEVCDKCNHLLHNGYAVLIELKDGSTMERKRPTGYAVAVLAEKFHENGSPAGVKMQPNTIYFIEQSQLKDFMKHEYSNPRDIKPSKFLTTAPRPINIQPKVSARSAAELVH